MKKGFTLIELVIVIAILAVLATVVVLVLNPAELLAQARDSQRISDLGSIKSAIGLYLSTVASPVVAAGPYATVNCVSNCPWVSFTVSSSTLVNSTGWVPIDLTQTSGGSPLSKLPLDPTQSATYFYAYKGDSTNKVFQLVGRLESQKFRSQMVSDGGEFNTCVTYTESTCFYETGTALNL